MPQIGRPQKNSSFGKISIGPKRSNKLNQTKESLSEELNRITGAGQEKQFVDRKTHNKLGKDGFLKLLSFQLANQDPTKPVDQKQFASDLAQFSQLEQLTNLNTKFDKMGSNAPQENKFYGASFLGKEIVTSGSSIHYDGVETQVNIPFFLDKAAKNVVINIYDSKKQLMGQIEAEDLGRGQHNLTWNGKQLDGIRSVKDDYRIEVRGYDQEMNPFKAETMATGVVTGVNFVNGETVLTLKGGKEVALRDVDSFRLPINKKNLASQQSVPRLQNNAAQAYNNINNSLSN